MVSKDSTRSLTTQLPNYPTTSVRAAQRDEKQIREWFEKRWPEKKAEAENYTLLFVDESGFYLLESVRRTWAPEGQTPVLRCKLTPSHLSVISAISPDGQLYLRLQTESFDSQGVITFQ